MKRAPSVKEIVRSAVKACRSFAKCSRNFFDFEKREGFCGWENWLTVDITRRLNSKDVIPFCPYSKVKRRLKGKLDISIESGHPIAVEIKINYIDEKDIERKGKHIPLPKRILKDAKKLSRIQDTISTLLLVSTCFESHRVLKKYRRRLELDKARDLESFQYRHWYPCSTGNGYNLLLALSNTPGLPARPGIKAG